MDTFGNLRSRGSEVRTDLRAPLLDARGSERQWMTELSPCLAGATAVRDPAEQWVYCVVISDWSVPPH